MFDCSYRSARRFQTAALLAVGACGLGVAPASFGQIAGGIAQGDIEVRLETWATGLGSSFGGSPQLAPTDMVPIFDGTGRMAISTQGGIVRVISADGTLSSTPLLTQTQTGSQFPNNGEWGMTSIAFHPDYGVAGAGGYGKFYTITTQFPSNTQTDFGNDFNHQDIVTEWTMADPNAGAWGGVGDTSRELMRVGQPGQPHNVVDLAFGQDKMLYISSGDGGADINNAGNPATVFGNILRIDPLGNNSANGKYGIPDDNPFANGQTVTVYNDSNPNGTTVDPLDEVFAYGFRSPFRMNFDKITGELWVGDVGQSNIEEIDRVVAGGNYGWNHKEGTFKSGQNLGASRVEPDTIGNNGYSTTQTLAEQFDLIDPEFQYDHDEGRSIVGGFVYRGSLIPELQGMYVFADLGENEPTARLFYGDPDSDDPTDFFEFALDPDGDLFFSNDSLDGALLPERIISLAEDENGELYILAVGVDPRQGGGYEGVVIQIVPEPGTLATLALTGAVLLRRRRSV